MSFIIMPSVVELTNGISGRVNRMALFLGMRALHIFSDSYSDSDSDSDCDSILTLASQYQRNNNPCLKETISHRLFSSLLLDYTYQSQQVQKRYCILSRACQPCFRVSRDESRGAVPVFCARVLRVEPGANIPVVCV